jgi:hypothetical protein
MASIRKRSVGKLSLSMTISVRPGRAATAARASLYSRTLVESATMHWPGAAPQRDPAEPVPELFGQLQPALAPAADQTEPH